MQEQPSSFYSQTTYTHIIDTRSPSQIQHQHQEVERIVSNNLKTLKVEMTPVTKIKYQPRNKIKVQLSNGWFCYITDSQQHITDNQQHRKHTVLTLHGAPGDHVEWAGLQTQTQGQYRWINLTIPGFDGQDERRGTYDGSCNHFHQLILGLLRHLHIPRVILVAHSLGAILSSYFIASHPEVVEGYVNITGIVDHWYVGLMTFFQTVVAQHGYNCPEWRQKRLMEDDKSRGVMYNLFLNTAEGRFFGNIEFPKLKQSEYFAIVKLFNSTPRGLSEFYNLNKNLNIMRVLIFGKDDPLHTWNLVQASIYNLCRGQSYPNSQQFRNMAQAAKKEVEERVQSQFGVKIDAGRLQEYFCYHFEETGHNAHKRRPKEIARIMAIYTACTEVLQQHKQMTYSKL